MHLYYAVCAGSDEIGSFSAIEIPLLVSISAISPQSTCHSALGCRILSKSVHPHRRYDVISNFKMAASAAQFYFQFQIGWRRLFSDVSFYQQNKFHSYNSICGWDITNYVFENKHPPYWNSTSGFDFDHITAVDMSFCTSLRNIVQIGPRTAKKMEKWPHIDFSRWHISAILDFRGPIMNCLKSPYTTSCT